MAIDLKPAPKRLSENVTHNGMSRAAATFAGVGGLGHPVSTGAQAIADSAAARPNQTAYGTLPKKFGPSPVNRDMRSRNFDTLHSGANGENLARTKQHSSDDMHGLGAAIMAECVLSGQQNSRTEHRSKHKWPDGHNKHGTRRKPPSKHARKRDSPRTKRGSTARHLATALSF